MLVAAPRAVEAGLRGRVFRPARAWRSGMIRLADIQSSDSFVSSRRPLSPFQRGRVLQLVAERLSGITIGDGTVYMVGKADQQNVLQTPTHPKTEVLIADIF